MPQIAVRFLLAVAVLAMPSVGFSGVIWKYTGTPFDTFEGDFFYPYDFLSGSVTFDTEPTAYALFGASNVVAFEFTAGPVTLTSADAEIRFPEQTFFEFDGSAANIDNWYLWVQDASTWILTTPQTDDVVYWPVASGAQSHGRGTWSAVPEPSTRAIWLLFGVIAVGFGWWKKPRLLHG